MQDPSDSCEGNLDHKDISPIPGEGGGGVDDNDHNQTPDSDDGGFDV